MDDAGLLHLWFAERGTPLPATAGEPLDPAFVWFGDVDEDVRAVSPYTCDAFIAGPDGVTRVGRVPSVPVVLRLAFRRYARRLLLDSRISAELAMVLDDPGRVRATAEQVLLTDWSGGELWAEAFPGGDGVVVRWWFTSDPARQPARAG